MRGSRGAVEWLVAAWFAAAALVLLAMIVLFVGVMTGLVAA